jgi:hypothetical protein
MYLHSTYILSRVLWYAWRKWRVLVRMIAFISTLVTHSLLITLKYRQYSANADLHPFQFTVAHALGFSVATSRLLATDLSTETSTQITTSTTQKIFQSHFKSSQTDFLFHFAPFAWFRRYYFLTTPPAYYLLALLLQLTTVLLPTTAYLLTLSLTHRYSLTIRFCRDSLLTSNFLSLRLVTLLNWVPLYSHSLDWTVNWQLPTAYLYSRGTDIASRKTELPLLLRSHRVYRGVAWQRAA